MLDRRRGILLAGALVVVVGALAIAAAVARRRDRAAGPHGGIVLFATPVNQTGRHELDALGGRLADLVAAGTRTAYLDSLVPRDVVVRTEAEFRSAIDPQHVDQRSVSRRLQPGMLVTSHLTLRGDTLRLGLGYLYVMDARGTAGHLAQIQRAGWRGTTEDTLALADSVRTRLVRILAAMHSCVRIPHPHTPQIDVCWRRTNEMGRIVAGRSGAFEVLSMADLIGREEQRTDEMWERDHQRRDSMDRVLEPRRAIAARGHRALGPHDGVLLVATPTNGTGDGALDSLAARLADRLRGSPSRDGAWLVPRADVLAAEAAVAAEPRSDASAEGRTMRRVDAGLLVHSVYLRTADTLFVTLRGVLAPPPSAPAGAIGGPFGSPRRWPLTRFRYVGWTGTGADTAALADSLNAHVAAIARALRDCDRDIRESARLPWIPLCWQGANVAGPLPFLSLPGSTTPIVSLDDGPAYRAAWRAEDARRR